MTCVYSTLAKLVVEEEKKENPDPIYHTQTVQTCTYNVYICVFGSTENRYFIYLFTFRWSTATSGVLAFMCVYICIDLFTFHHTVCTCIAAEDRGGGG